MIADTTFVIDLLMERRRGKTGPARSFLTAHRTRPFATTIITFGEVAVSFEAEADVYDTFGRWAILRLTPGVALAAAAVDREQIAMGRRLGENDNWIAGFARYYRRPLISRDQGFDAVPGIRRIAY